MGPFSRDRNKPPFTFVFLYPRTDQMGGYGISMNTPADARDIGPL